MKFDVLTIPPFDRQFKKLAKKYPSLKTEIAELAAQLSDEPKTGTSLGNDCYKIRLSIASKGKGKSGGGRVITYVLIKAAEVYLLSIYDKSELESITDADIKDLLKYIEE